MSNDLCSHRRTPGFCQTCLELEVAFDTLKKCGISTAVVDALRLGASGCWPDVDPLAISKGPTDLTDTLPGLAPVYAWTRPGVVLADEVDPGVAVRPPDQDADGVLVERPGDLGGGAGSRRVEVPAVVPGRGAHHLDDGRRLPGALPEALALDDGEALEALGQDLVDSATEALGIHDSGTAGPARPGHAPADEEGGDTGRHEVAEPTPANGSSSWPPGSSHDATVAELPSTSHVTLRRRAARRYPTEQFVTVTRTKTGFIVETSWLPASARWLLGPRWRRLPDGYFRLELSGGAGGADIAHVLSRVGRAMFIDLVPEEPEKPEESI